MRVLLATDGSSHARHAEKFASRIPGFAAADWFVLSVVPLPIAPFIGIEPIGAPMIADELSGIFEAQVESSRHVLEDSVRRLTPSVNSVKSLLVEGEAVEEILATVESERIDIVVIGSRGLGGLGALLLGSVAKSLAHKCPCSLLISHQELDGPASVELGPRKLRIAIGVDGSPGSDAALEAVRTCGDGVFESISLIAALPFSGIPAGIGRQDSARAYEEEAADAESMLHARAETLKTCADHVFSVHTHATPHDALIEYARQKQIDLVAVGAARHGFLERIVLGSSAGHLASHAPCPVWIVRPSIKTE